MSLRPAIFISAVSSELRSARQLVANTLTFLGYDPEWQDVFSTQEGDLRAVKSCMPRENIQKQNPKRARPTSWQKKRRDRSTRRLWSSATIWQNFSRVLNPSHPETLRTCFDLARCSQARAETQEAIQFAQRAAEGGLRVLGPEHPETKKYQELEHRLQAGVSATK
jgi:hypothetical protein